MLYVKPITSSVKVWLIIIIVFLYSCKNSNSEVNSNVNTGVIEKTLDYESYELVWYDEFDYSGNPDPKKWTYENGFVRNMELQWYQSENAFVRDGLLIIEGRKDTFPNPGYNNLGNSWQEKREYVHYTSSSVTTKGLHSWRYGIFEIKAKIVTQNGLWPAIWTLGAGYEWPTGGEIDIMEYYDDNILANAAWASKERYKAIWDDFRKPIDSFDNEQWAENFHIWKMEWTSRAINIYLDDFLMNSIDLDITNNQRGEIKNPFRETNQFIILNLAIGGTSGGDPSEVIFPSKFEIDYVRVYQKF
tara:strand:+ start:976 stop:1881 length:906 start_codon:yes stop_codon:yes gene_type:complete